MSAAEFLRIGCVKYLNARPLIHGWPGPVRFDHPAVLCAQLANGDLDVALVSSFEFLRNPIYRIVDDLSISSAGPVYSVVVAHHGDISEVDEIELDPASETSVNLLRCLLAELNLTPREVGNIDLQSVRPAGLQPVGYDGAKNISARRTGNIPMFPTARHARLLIGDQAIRSRQAHAEQFRFWDLGEQWNKLVGLPFVYALCLIRPEVRNYKSVAARLRKLRNENLADIDKLVAEEKEFDPDFSRRYYRENLRFSFGEKEKAGLMAFCSLCEKYGLLPKHEVELAVV